jgi:hypothetical protein
MQVAIQDPQTPDYGRKRVVLKDLVTHWESWGTNGPWLEVTALLKYLTWSVATKVLEISDHVHLIEISVLMGDA